MSLLMMRGAILAQGGSAAPPVDIGTAWQLDTSRRPAGYTLSDGNQTAVNTSGGANYLRWVPTAKAILPSDGRRYWEVLCAASGAAIFDGYIGAVSAAQREEYNAGLNPITLGSIGWRVAFSISLSMLRSREVTNRIASPLRPARPVRPMRWT